MGKSEATPTATKGEGEKVMVLTTLEVDPATEDPDLLDAIRYARRHHRRSPK